jgi:hypothetical protein
MMTNVLEVFNFVLQRICSLPDSGIVDYTFHKCNKYFIDRWGKPCNTLANGEQWGEPRKKQLREQAEIPGNEVATLFDPTKLLYEVKSSSRMNIGGEISNGRIYRAEIEDVVSCTRMTPTLFLHIPCSHVITACCMCRVLHERSSYMSSYYLLTTEKKTWGPRFEPLLNLSYWPMYEGLQYVPDVAMRKMCKGRQKKKLTRNKMDDTENCYDNDMYGFSDFDQNKTKVHCSVYHGEGHTMEIHKESPKRKPRNSGAKDMNHRQGTSAIIEVSHV